MKDEGQNKDEIKLEYEANGKMELVDEERLRN